MTGNVKLKQGQKEYLKKLKLGNAKRLNPIEKAKQNPRSLRLAINAKCYDCCCEQRAEVKYCPVGNCSLHYLRPWQTKSLGVKLKTQ